VALGILTKTRIKIAAKKHARGHVLQTNKKAVSMLQRRYGKTVDVNIAFAFGIPISIFPSASDHIFRFYLYNDE